MDGWIDKSLLHSPAATRLWICVCVWQLLHLPDPPSSTQNSFWGFARGEAGNSHVTLALFLGTPPPRSLHLPIRNHHPSSTYSHTQELKYAAKFFDSATPILLITYTSAATHHDATFHTLPNNSPIIGPLQPTPPISFLSFALEKELSPSSPVSRDSQQLSGNQSKNTRNRNKQ